MRVIGLFFIWQLIFSAVFTVKASVLSESSSRIQDFETEFTVSNSPNEFLPDWYGNEVRASSSRIYQAKDLGKNGSRALAVQPISSFDGEIVIRLSVQEFNNPQVHFWARSVKNGSGSRPAQVFYSWSKSLGSDFSEPLIIGGANEFGNENQEFRLFELELPEAYQDLTDVFLRLEIRYGPGSGTCAKWLMDDFEFGEFVVDQRAPKVSMVRGFDGNEVEVQFDEGIDPVFSEFLLNYKLDGREPSLVQLKADSLVYLSFDEKLEIGKNYELEISQIPDFEGNFLRDTLITFQFFDPTYIPFKTLVINEIMPAPKADFDLPNVEYVEVYHAGEYAIRLGGVTWSNSKSTLILKDEWVQSGEIVVLVPENQAVLLKEYGRVIGIKSWPTLINSGDQLRLKDDQGGLIDHISYSSSSWGGSEFANGGYSIEVANPFYACEQSDLLMHSVDPLRGTPGRQNSVYDLSPDETIPALSLYEFTSRKSLLLTFSKPILTGFDHSNVALVPILGIDSIAQIGAKKIHVFFSYEVPANIIYSMYLTGIKDCSGNEYNPSEPIKLVFPVQARAGDILINELLFNPKTGSPKFVEVVNVTDNYLELKDWKLANLADGEEIGQVKKIGESSISIPPKGFLAITTNPDFLKLDFPKSAYGEFAKIAALPSYPIAGGTVVLLDSAGSVADSFPYSEDLHHPLLRDSKGVSLERLSTESPASLPANWHSASAIEEFATPGRRNSQVISSEFEGDVIQIDPQAFDPEGSNGNTFTSIRYELGQSGWIGSFRVYSTTGQLVQVLAQNELLGAAGLFTWTGTDGQGKIARPGYYILLVELYDLSGQMRTIRKTVVVATKL